MSSQPAYAHPGIFIPEWTFADRLRKARQATGLDQREFASQIGVKGGAYAQWEAGNTRPRDIVAIAENVERISHVSAIWLLGMTLAPVGPAGIEPTTSTVESPRLAPITPLRRDLSASEPITDDPQEPLSIHHGSAPEPIALIAS